MPALNWVPAPRYILRRDRVLEVLNGSAPCKVLDIGCGPGALISELSTLGHVTYGVDRSDKALEIGRHLEIQSPRMHLRRELDQQWIGTFDVLLSLEVIEHVEDDAGALREWRQYLKSGGKMILSTPAHHRRWNAADEWAGHVRRYEREDLVQVIESAGFVVERIETFGFPLANIIDRLAAPVYRRGLQRKKRTHASAAALTDDSGTDRASHTRLWPLYSSKVSASLVQLFCRLQRAFRNTELGPSFIVIARAV
jgi:SAM-dependent methyltransferase